MPAPRGKNLLRARDLSFKSVWRELRANGWTSRRAPGRSLDDRYRYVRPGGDPKGQEGVDFFIGAEDVLEYYVNITQASAFSAGPSPAAPAPSPAAPAPSPAAPAPSIVFSTPQFRERGKTARRPTRASRELIPTSPHVDLDSDAETCDFFELDNDGDEDYVDDEAMDSVSETGTVESTDERPRNPDDVVAAPDIVIDKEGSLNVTAPDDDADEFGAMDSGDEVANDDLVDGEDGEILPDELFDDGDTVAEDQTEAAVEQELLFAQHFLETVGGEQAILVGNLEQDVLREMSHTGWEDVEEPETYDYMQEPYEPVVDRSSYPGLRQGYSGATADALRRGASPLALFFYFMPVPLWQHIALCSNEYNKEKTPDRVDEALRRYKRKRVAKPSLPKKTRRDILHDLESMKPIMAHEICRFFGLLIARAIMPNREKLANHWKTTDEGGIPRGTFGAFLSRDRFRHISRNLHFNPNDHEKAKVDRAWKIRKVVDVLQTTFERGYVPPAHLAFDEAILPSRSSFNKMRVYLKDKPHKWGTKLFMLCSAVSAYCIRFEVYCKKKQHASDAHKPDMKSGPAAVVRNLLAVFGPDAKKQGMRLVVVDRFYTSVALAIQLLVMGFYCIGTIMTNRVGYSKEVVEKKKTRPKDIERGSFKMAKSKLVPNMTAISWWDSRPVHFLSTGGSLKMDRVVRRDTYGVQHEVPCPRAIKDYHAFMGGVDVHDQLRLQRYSLQRAVRFQKYYKSLVLGLIDMAIVNGYIIHKEFYEHKEDKPMSHVVYLKTLHLQLCQLQATDMYEGNEFGVQSTPAPVQPERLFPGSVTEGAHMVQQVQAFRNQDTQNKRYRQACKVCSTLKEGKRAKTSTFYCNDCSQSGPVFLCLRSHRKVRGAAATCWDIWHRDWKNGRLIPLSWRGEFGFEGQDTPRRMKDRWVSERPHRRRDVVCATQRTKTNKLNICSGLC